MHYILSGDDAMTPVKCDDLVDWGMWMGRAQRQVGFTEIGEVTVGTAFFGIAARYRGGAPILFETLISGGSDRYPRQEYCSWGEAVAGHARWVNLVSDRRRLHEAMASWADPSRPFGEAM